MNQSRSTAALLTTRGPSETALRERKHSRGVREKIRVASPPPPHTPTGHNFLYVQIEIHDSEMLKRVFDFPAGADELQQ